MIEKYLINYLKDNSTNLLTKKYLDYFKVELDWFIYNYGDHVSTTHRRGRKELKFFIYSYLQYVSALTRNIDKKKKIVVISYLVFILQIAICYMI